MKKSIQQKKYTENIYNANSQKVNILMADDHPENLLALEAVLSSPNYNLVSATSGKEALKCLLKQEFAVILLDVQMPGLNGFETAKLIRAREKTKHTPIIFITAISQDLDHVEKGYSVGAIDYIFKPFHPETLKQKIGKFVELYQKHEDEISKSEWQRTVELKEVNQKLDRTTLNLRRTEALTKVVGETLIDTIVTFDEHECILSVNPAVKSMFGYKPDELIGQNVSTLFLEMIGEPGEPHFLDLIRQGIGKVVEVVAIRRDQSYFPADLQIGEATIEDTKIFVCDIRDVTERKQMEAVKKQQFDKLEKMVEERTIELLLANEKLQQEIVERKKISDHLFVSQERFRKIFESSPNLMAIFSLKDGSYLDVNTSWVTLTGYSYDELQNQKINLHDFIEEAAGGSINIEQPIRNVKIQYKTKSGDMRAGLLSSEMIHIEPESCILLVLTDITERVHLEKEMARLENLNLIGEMAAGIAHEIRNPMTTVFGFLQVARDGQLSNEAIDLMLDELNRANSIITEFLTLAKNKVSNKQKQDLNTIVHALFPLIQAEAMRVGKK